jgi:hypothetical protein
MEKWLDSKKDEYVILPGIKVRLDSSYAVALSGCAGHSDGCVKSLEEAKSKCSARYDCEGFFYKNDEFYMVRRVAHNSGVTLEDGWNTYQRLHTYYPGSPTWVAVSDPADYIFVG